jgi:hypothetical protein
VEWKCEISGCCINLGVKVVTGTEWPEGAKPRQQMQTIDKRGAIKYEY